MSLKIPYNLSRKAATFPESPDGVKKATLILIDGRKINDVYLTKEGEIIKIGNKPVYGIRDYNFSNFEIQDIISEM